jgi:hypothetical protein
MIGKGKPGPLVPDQPEIASGPGVVHWVVVGHIRRAGPVLVSLPVGGTLILYSLRGRFDWEWLDSSDARLCFPLILLVGGVYLANHLRRSSVGWPPLVKTALRLAIGSLSAGVSIFALYVLSHSDVFALLGTLTLLLGFAAVTIGILCLMFHVAGCRSWSEVHGRKSALTALLLLSNFLVAFGIMKAVLDPVGHVTGDIHPLVPVQSAK